MKLGVSVLRLACKHLYAYVMLTVSQLAQFFISVVFIHFNYFPKEPLR